MSEERNNDIGIIVKEIRIKNKPKINITYHEGERIININPSLSSISDEVHDDESRDNATDLIEQKSGKRYDPDFPYAR